MDEEEANRIVFILSIGIFSKFNEQNPERFGEISEVEYIWEMVELARKNSMILEAINNSNPYKYFGKTLPDPNCLE